MLNSVPSSCPPKQLCQQDPLYFFKTALQDGERFVKAPSAMCGATMLSALSIAAQGLIDVITLEGTKKPVSLFFITSAKSGDRKTSTESLYFKPIHEWSGYLFDQSHDSASLDEAACLIWNRQKNHLLRTVDEVLAAGDSTDGVQNKLAHLLANRPTAGQSSQLLFQNTTLTALLDSLATGWPYVGLSTAEGGNVLNSRMEELIPLLSVLWDGGQIQHNRAQKKYIVRDARLTLAIQIQPGILRGYLGKSAGQARLSGFLSRCLVAEPESTQGSRFISLQDIEGAKTSEAIEHFHNRLLVMLYASKNKPERIALKFTSAAKQVLLNFFNQVEGELGNGGRLADISDCASKITDNLCRIAALLHYFCEESGDIDVPITQYAANICLSYLANFKQLFGFRNTAQQAMEDAEKLHWYLRSRLVVVSMHSSFNQQAAPTFLLRSEIANKGPLRGGVEQMDAALQILQQSGVIYVQRFNKSQQVYLNHTRSYQIMQERSMSCFTRTLQ